MNGQEKEINVDNLPLIVSVLDTFVLLSARLRKFREDEFDLLIWERMSFQQIPAIGILRLINRVQIDLT